MLLKIYKTLLIFLLSLILVACSTKHVSIAPSTNLKLVADNVVVKVVGQNINSTVLDKLTHEINDQLIIAGFNTEKETETETDKRINLNVYVTAFTPGNTALRMTVGFGAGRGSLLYTAEYTNQVGQTLAKMDGNERFVGGWFSEGEEVATEVLINDAGRHIVDLALK